MKKNKLLIIAALVLILFAAAALIFERRGLSGLKIGTAGEDSGIDAGISSDPIIDSSDYLVAHSQISKLPLESLSAEEKKGLIAMREEEKLAHDVYMALYEKWGINIFRNIAKSESTHTESVRYLIERYGLEDPVKDETAGIFSNPIFLNLYNDLTEKGYESLAAAFKVGAIIEDLDIKDLNELSKEVDNQDVLEIYANLTRGSRNHLRSFFRQLEGQGLSYSAQYLSQEEVDVILSSEQERGANN